VITRQQQITWEQDVRDYIDAADLDDLPVTDLDEFVKDTPIPAGLEMKSCELINTARKNWKRLDASKYPACEVCLERGEVLVDGACKTCQSNRNQRRSCDYQKRIGPMRKGFFEFSPCYVGR